MFLCFYVLILVLVAPTVAAQAMVVGMQMADGCPDLPVCIFAVAAALQRMQMLGVIIVSILSLYLAVSLCLSNIFT